MAKNGEHSRRKQQKLPPAEEKQRRFLRQVIDINPNFVFAKDRQGRFTLVNQAVADAYGTTVDELIGKTDADFNKNPAEVEHFRQDDLAVMDNLQEKFIPEEFITDASGRLRCLQTVKRPLVNEDGYADQVLGVATDITERKQHEQALREASMVISSGTGRLLFENIARHLTTALPVKFALIAELSRYPHNRLTTVVLCDRDGICDDAGVEIAVGSSGDELTAGDLKAATAEFARAVLNAVPTRSAGVEPAAAPACFFGVPLYDSNSAPLGILAVIDSEPLRDRAQVESFVQIFAARVSAELERTQAEKARRELEAKMQQVQKLEHLGILAGGIAHDFNNLLMGILGNASLILQKSADNAAISRYAEHIRCSAERAAVLTNQLLAYSGKAAFKIDRIDMSSLVLEMGGLLRAAADRGISVRYHCKPGLPAVEADIAQMQQVIMNLITNATEAIGEGHGKVEVFTDRAEGAQPQPGFVRFGTLCQAQEYVVLEVRDTGVGMDGETLQRMFDPFFTTKFTGRGLGLAAVLGIVRTHRGIIDVASKLGEGTVFRMLLPAAAPNAEAAEQPETVVSAPAMPGSWQGSGKVLVVDDEQMVREVAREMLMRLGFEVACAASGEEALEIYREPGSGIDYVLLDMTMPAMSGSEVFKRLQAIDPEVHVIFSSGYAEQIVEDRSREKTVQFIQKPFDLARLAAAMRRACEEAEGSGALEKRLNFQKAHG